MTEPQQTFYDAVGGAETFRSLTAKFYEEVAKDEIVRPLLQCTFRTSVETFVDSVA